MKNLGITSEGPICAVCDEVIETDLENHTYHLDYCISRDSDPRFDTDCNCRAEEVHDMCCPDCTMKKPPLEIHRALRAVSFYPDEIDLVRVPPLYATEPIPVQHKMVHLQYSLGTCSWWIVERDPETNRGFGYAYLGGSPQDAEWGYVDLTELEALTVPVPVKSTTGASFSTMLVVVRSTRWWPRPIWQSDLPGSWR